MRWGLLLSIGIALAACSPRIPDETPAEGYRNWWDRTRVALRLEDVLGYPCTRDVRSSNGETVVESLPSEQCYRFNPPERIDGVWVNDFEGSALLTQEEYAAGRFPNNQTWIDIGERAPRALRAYPMQTVYRVSFIGRRATHVGMYGHFGMSRNLVLMDRIISIRPISRPE